MLCHAKADLLTYLLCNRLLLNYHAHDPPGSNWKVTSLSDNASDNGQVTWLNVTVGRQRRHVRSLDKAETGRTCVFCCCSAAVELSANGYSLYRWH